ncbi:hypothetical protein [Pontimicrobium sp. SW4]|uniref:RES domain-containing protein n=1 Tax=Pontimicrobium sp. SW4 TaxID=3153519 RepID=A0AAU7BSG5_9FLAO
MLNQFNQPLIVSNSTLFVDEIRSYFDNYKAFSSNLLNSHVETQEDIDYYETKIQKNIESISECLVSYRNGHRIESANNFQLLMLQNLKRLMMMLSSPETEKKSNHVFYRIRRGLVDLDERKKSPNHTLFHLPFNLRHLVGTGRFNSAGIPILYLSDCLKIPYYECDEPKTAFCDDSDGFNNMNIGFFRNVKSFKFFDFSIQAWEDLIEKHNKRPTESPLLNYLVLYPIIAAIHVKINYSYSVNFRFDYVFSALIMDFVKNLEKDNVFRDIGLLLPIFSIKYSSVKLFSKQTTINRHNECYSLHNYAFMANYYDSHSHCIKLESIFLKNHNHKELYSESPFFEKYKNKALTEKDILDIESYLKS